MPFPAASPTHINFNLFFWRHHDGNKNQNHYGKVNLKDSFVRITKKGELVVMNMHISPYDFGNYNNHDPLRTRRLLMHRREIDRLLGKVKEKGYSLIPLKLYFKHGFVKMELALCTGKKIYDKRRDMADRDAKREMQRVIKERNKF